MTYKKKLIPRGDQIGEKPNRILEGRTIAMDAEIAGATAETRDWSEMTPVLLVNVFRRLSLEDRWRGVMFACKTWLEAARDPALFESFDLEPFFGRFSDAATWWTPAFQRRVDSMVRLVAVVGGPTLRTVRVRHCSDRALELVAERLVEFRGFYLKVGF